MTSTHILFNDTCINEGTNLNTILLLSMYNTKVEIMIVLFSTVLKKANSQMKSLHIQLEISNIPKLTFNLKQKKTLNFGIDQIMGEIYSCTTWKENAESCSAETICMIHPHSFVCCLKKNWGCGGFVICILWQTQV